MNHRSNIRHRRYGCLGVIMLNALAWAALMWLLASLCGCTRTTYVPVESARTEYRDRDVERVVTDTVRDTRFVWVKGDTVVDIRDRWHKSLEYIHDTCYIERRDSVPVPYPVERKFSRWEQAKMDFGGFALGGIAVTLCAAAIWLIRKLRK